MASHSCPDAPSINELISRACRRLLVEPSEVKNPQRRYKTGEPAQLARLAVMHAARKHGYSCSRIGHRLGRDHSTIVYGVKQAIALAATDLDYAALLLELAE